ncbi:MAG: glycosyltransferase [Bacteroidia bacterium]
MPSISVIIPAYNAASYLKETVESVLHQTFADFEIIIIDDGSRDNTAEVAQSIHDPRVKYFYSENKGVASARNKGAQLANGKYLAFLDADDLFYSDNLIKKHHFLEAHPDTDLVFSDCDIINEFSAKTGETIIGNDHDLLNNLLLWKHTVIPGPSSILVTRKAYEAVKGFDSDFSTAADQDFFFRIGAQFKCIRIPEILTAYRKHGNNMHMNITLMEKDHIGVYKKAEANNLFKNIAFKNACFGNLYMILAGSWWVNGKNKPRALYFILKSIFHKPSVLFTLLKKLA